MKIENFADIEAEFIRRVHTMVWCSAATVDGQNRPRSRVLHPIWEGSTGWVTTNPNSHKARHLAKNPHISLAYITDMFNPVYVDCVAEWVDSFEERKRIWELFKNTPPPLGFDPILTFPCVDHPDYGVLKLTPWRIDLVSFPAASMDAGTKVWRRK